MQQKVNLLDFLAFPGVGPGGPAGDELGVGFQHVGNDAQAVRLDGGAGFRDFHDGVHQAFHYLGLGGAPGIFHLDVNASAGEEILGHAHDFRGNAFAVKVFGLMVGRIPGHGQHPAGRPRGDFGINEVGHHFHIGLVFHDPVLAGQAHVQHAVGDVAGNFLGPGQAHGDFRIVDFRKVIAAVRADFPAGAGEKIDGGLFQGAFGNAQLQLVGDGIHFL